MRNRTYAGVGGRPGWPGPLPDPATRAPHVRCDL